MRTIAATLLTIAALAATASAALGQEEETTPPIDAARTLTVITNEEFCGLLSADVLVCEGIITGMATAHVVPEAFADLVATEAPDEPQADALEPEPSGDGGTGDTLARDDVEITLLRADWKPDISDAFYKPAKGNKYVSVLVRYTALDDGVNYNIIFWDATDKKGNRYEATVLYPVTPDLKVGTLAAGEMIEGWVTYEVPRNVAELRVIESQVLEDDLAWNIGR